MMIFASYVSRRAFKVKECLSRILQFHPTALPKLPIPVSICCRSVQGVLAPRLQAGQRNLPRRPCRQPEAQPFLPPNTGLRVGALGRGGQPPPQEKRSWITMITNRKYREMPCYCKPGSPQAQRGPSSVCRVGSMWWPWLCWRRHLGWQDRIAHLLWSCGTRGSSNLTAVGNLAAVLKWPMEPGWK